MTFLLGMLVFSAAGWADANVEAEPGPSRRVFEKNPQGREIVSGELLVRFRDARQATASRENVGGQKVASEKGYSTFPRTKLVRFGEEAALEKALEALKRSADVEAVSYNYVRRASATVANDPLFDNLSQWALNNEGQIGGLAGADVGALEGWDRIKEAPNIVIAVIDSGIRYTHEDLAANMWINPGEIAGNGIDDDNNGYVDDVHGINAIDGSGDPLDDHGHGTHVAGVMGAVGNNGVGIAGLVWNAQIMALKFLDDQGDGSDADAIECIDYARSKGAHIINNSWGGAGYNSVMRQKISDAGEEGIFFIAAAGNEGANIDDSQSFPASYDLPNIISVTATDRKNRMPQFANFGEDSVDIAAPGVAIYSTYIGSDSDYRILSGTSMATPLVSATIACLLELYPEDAMATTLSRLYSSVEVLPSLARRCRTGGRLNFAAALQEQIAKPINDSFGSATLVAESQIQTSGANEAATIEVGEPEHDPAASGKSVWWKWVAKTDGVAEASTAGSDFFSVLGVYEGETIATLETLGKAVEPATSIASLRGASVTFDARAGAVYYFAVDGYLSDYGNVSLSIGQSVDNDAFENRIALEGIDIVATANNASATAEEGETGHAGGAASRSLWWEWVAPVSGYVTFTTASTNSVDTLMGVYVGDAVGDLTEMYSDDDSGPGWTSEIAEAFVVQGVPYVIAVDGWNGEFGDISLAITHGENDAFRDARVFVGDTFSDMAFNSTARKEAGEPLHGNNAGGRSLWWRWTATVGGDATVSTFGSDFDTLLGVYVGEDLISLVAKGQSDDDGGSKTSQVLFEAEAGETYMIAVDGFRGDFGYDYGVVRVQASVFADGSQLAPVLEDPGEWEAKAGDAFTYALKAANEVDVYSVAGLPEGLVLDAATGVISGTPILAGTFWLEMAASNDQGTGERLVSLTVLPAGGSPQVRFVLDEKRGLEGDTLVLEAEVTTDGEGSVTYQWIKDGEAVLGATERVYTIPSLADSNIGYYAVRATNAFGSALSGTQQVRFSDARIGSLSTQGMVGVESGGLQMRFEIRGNGPQRVLAQGLGPSLWSGKFRDALMDPELILVDGEGLEARFAGWKEQGNAEGIEAASTALGARKLDTDRDAALLATLEPGEYTLRLESSGGGRGYGLIELFYANEAGAAVTRFSSMRSRSWIKAENEANFSCLVVEGSEPKRLLLRAVGPSMSAEGGYTKLADPYLKIYRGRKLIDVNDDWGTGDAEEMEAIFGLAGAEALPRGSGDAALLVELEPGRYTVRISDLGDSAGVCGFEVFEVN